MEKSIHVKYGITSKVHTLLVKEKKVHVKIINEHKVHAFFRLLSIKIIGTSSKLIQPKSSAATCKTGPNQSWITTVRNFSVLNHKQICSINFLFTRHFLGLKENFQLHIEYSSHIPEQPQSPNLAS